MSTESRSQASTPLAHGDINADHERFQADDQIWKRFPFQGIQPGLNGQVFEMRGCPCCESTLNRSISLKDALGLLGEQCSMVARTLNALS
jgi:hypothetical protein